MIKVVMLVILWLTSIGCGNWHYSVSPYANVGNSMDIKGGGYWQAGVSVTLFDNVPGYPAVPDLHINNTKVNIVNSNTQSQNQTQTQDQDQSENNHIHNNNQNGNKK
jgi:hypothetical protein